MTEDNTRNSTDASENPPYDKQVLNGIHELKNLDHRAYVTITGDRTADGDLTADIVSGANDFVLDDGEIGLIRHHMLLLHFHAVAETVEITPKTLAQILVRGLGDENLSIETIRERR